MQYSELARGASSPPPTAADKTPDDIIGERGEGYVAVSPSHNNPYYQELLQVVQYRWGNVLQLKYVQQQPNSQRVFRLTPSPRALSLLVHPVDSIEP